MNVFVDVERGARSVVVIVLPLPATLTVPPPVAVEAVAVRGDERRGRRR